MSDKEIPKYEAIPRDAIVELKISGAFHKRLVLLYFNACKSYGPEKTEEYAHAIADRTFSKLATDQDRENAYSMETLFTLLKDLEQTFRDKGLLVQEELDLPNEG